MHMEEALTVARHATKIALERANWDQVKADEILLLMRLLAPQIDRAFNVAGLAMVEADQAGKH